MPEGDNVPADDQIDQVKLTENDTISEVDLAEPRSKFGKMIDFVIKNKIIFLILLVIIVILSALFVLIPVIDIGDTRLTNANTLVRIKADQTIKLKVSDVSIKVTHFTNDVCPVGKACFGTGVKAVEYQMTVNGKKYATGSQNPATDVKYKIETVSSDFETYADIKVIKLK